MDDCRLILGDCLDVLPTLAAGSVDLVCADPPYGTTNCKWDSVIPLDRLWAELGRVVRVGGAVVLIACQPFTSRLVMSNPRQFRVEWIREKSNATGYYGANRRPLRAHESVLVFSRGRRPTYRPQKTAGTPYRTAANGEVIDTLKERRPEALRWVTDNRGWRFPRSVLRFNCERGLHPTQKPVALMEYLVRTYSDAGDTVLDFCMGSGTTGVACLRAGRKFVGIEKDADYFALARRRLAAFQGGPAHPDAREVEAEVFGPLFAQAPEGGMSP